MHKIIALFNHKGGVSKTTTTYALGWMLAEKGYRVVMIDADPQCNLSGLVFGDTLDNFYSNNPKQNIYTGLEPAFKSQPQPIKAIDCIEVKSRTGLFLLPGHVNLSEYEVTLGIAQELSSTLHTLRNLPGAFYYFIGTLAEANKADFVLIDMNPSLGAINQNFLMSSDYFIIPTSPDYFCMMAIDSLATILPRWAEWAKRSHASKILQAANYPFPEFRLKLLGTIIQKYRPRLNKPTVGFRKWIDEINLKVSNKLFPDLKLHELTLPDQAYMNIQNFIDENYCLAQIPDFNTLIATSQLNKTPVFALTDQMFKQVGTVLIQSQKKCQEFHNIFSILTDRVIALTK